MEREEMGEGRKMGNWTGKGGGKRKKGEIGGSRRKERSMQVRTGSVLSHLLTFKAVLSEVRDQRTFAPFCPRLIHLIVANITTVIIKSQRNT